ncbi:MAG: hypothetical protein DLM52_04980 [Chthoniobacterales bacterium]|nr:MAG: hypothetical protein DLM52_04980 [Chthoniobacterales bacterium]
MTARNPFWTWFGAIGGGALVIALLLLWWTKSNFSAADAEFRASAGEQRQLESGNPYPSDANVRKMKGHLADYHASLDKLKAELGTHVLGVPPLAPNEFQSRLLQAITNVAENARANRVKLPDNFKLGFDEFVSTLPKTEEATALGQELAQIQLLLNLIIETRVDAVTMFRRVKPEASPTPTIIAVRAAAAPAASSGPRAGAAPAESKMINRRAVEFSVAGPPSATRKIINGIASANDQFFIARTLHVKNQKEKGPSRETPAPGNTPAPIATPAANPGAAAPGASPAGTPAGAIQFVVGNEHVDLSARVELINFEF